MIAYSRVSQYLAGAASLKYGVPAVIGAFGIHLDIAQSVRATACKLSVAGSIPAIPKLREKQLATE